MNDSQPFGFYLVFFIIPFVAAIPVTASICWFRTRRHKHVSYGTMCAGAGIIPLLLFLFCTIAIISSGIDAKTPSPFLFLRLFALSACVCTLPALLVVHYYQRRNKRDEKPVA
jgi:hypothetical protein